LKGPHITAPRKASARVRGLSLCAALAIASLPASVRAADEADGAYGRFDGDLDLRVGAGAAFARGGPALAAHASLLYLSSAGLYAHYTDALGSAGPAVARSIAAGLVIEPLFLGRYALDLERGPARLDLGLDSLAIGVGAFWEAPRDGSLVADTGLEISLGAALPILARASGPILGVRGALRLRPRAITGEERFDLLDQGALLSLTLAYRHVLPVHLVDAGDRATR